MMVKQIEILKELQKIGYNIITCGECGSVNIVRKAKETFRCYDCFELQQHHDCPDLFY